MAVKNNININVLDDIIIGRVEPQIYAFTTETIPNYLKVGDTYRPIEVRLKEWREHFPNLEKKFENVAKVDDETFFRDYAVHSFLENELKRKRLKRNTLKNIYYSNEFFENATIKDLEDAIKDIKQGHQNNESKYQYYRFDESLIPEKHTYTIREKPLHLRPNQKETVEKFKKAIKKGRKNLLMYAVMRFGKTFTSLCCAVEMGAELVVVVSAKADVKEEWKKTVESLKNFEKYCFLESEDLLRNESIIAEKQKANKKIVLFLTLQDLQGDEIKLKHKEVFENQFDLLLIDETHFGARAAEYGKVLIAGNLKTKDIKSEEKLNEISIDKIDDIEKALKAKIRIHLSGTPYRILMNSEFTKDDIIAFYQFTNIADDQEKWDLENLNKDEIKEWDNPYYGFPQMIRFAFNPNESSIKKLEELKKKGVTYAFSELFRPHSIAKDSKKQLHQKFIHETEILDLLKVIDGSETDKNLLSFLDYDKIKEGKMCRHIVCVLPYRASCDALEELIKTNKFKHLSNYEIINISGVENEKNYKDTQSVQAKIKKCESENVKTITLTVNRMLTGSTVHEWDTMLYLKDTASPQEYDQAIFRLQNQYIKEFVDDKGDVIKYNMKPQTLLVDFNPTRMFVMQEEKAQIYNINTEKNGNLKLVERLKRELEVSPIIQLNKDKLVQVIPTDILNAVREYSSNRSVIDEAKVIPLDFSLLKIDEIREEIERQNEIDANNGLKIKPHEKPDEGEELDLPEKTEGGEGTETGTNKSKEDKKDNYEAIIKKKFASYYSRILFFAFCTEAKIISLQEIIDLIEKDEECQRIANNLELNIEILKLLRLHIQHYVLSKLEYKIQNINTLANDTDVEPKERASRAMKKFTRLSESEIVTPELVTDKMINGLPENAINKNTMLLDIASKQGEFVYAVYKKFGAAIANNFYSIPTSKIAYEFTRKVYKLLELDVKLIEANYTSYDLINENTFIEKETLKINNQKMKFNIILGNPPYQDRREGTSDNPIYHLFMDMAYQLSEKVVLVTPGRFLFNAGKTPNIWNQKMLEDKNLKVVAYFNRSQDVFPEIDLMGGIVITLRDKSQTFNKIENFTSYSEIKSIIKKVLVDDFQSLSDLIYAPESYKFSKKLHELQPNIANKLSKGHLYDLTTNIFSKLPNIFLKEKPTKSDDYIQIFGRENNNRIAKWIKRIYVESHDNLEYYKVLVPKSNGSGAIGVVIPTVLIGVPQLADKGTGHNQSFISIGSFKTKYEAESCMRYISTKFARLLLGALKVTQDNKKNVWKYVPFQDFSKNSKIDWAKSISEIDQQLYAKYKLPKDEIDFIEKMIKPMD
ncbi:MAG: Eco57I restriction-modification methylase domain-containing protein [Vicingaceae bacterium]|nr:Eco57I restriction-modification methylase domain-containing protein [Vicingaceae bacterium]